MALGVTPARRHRHHNEIDLDRLLSGENTLYISAPIAVAHRYAPAIGGLIGDLMNQAFDRFNRTGRPLIPGVLVVMDEAANVPMRRMPEWASTVPGIGVQLLTNHVTKRFFGGMSDLEGHDYIGRLLGEEHVPSTLRRNARHDDWESPSRIPLAQPNVLRQLRRGEGLLIHSNLPAAHVKALRVTRGRFTGVADRLRRG